MSGPRGTSYSPPRSCGSLWVVDATSGELRPATSRTVAPHTGGDDLGATGQRWGTLFAADGDFSGVVGIDTAPDSAKGQLIVGPADIATGLTLPSIVVYGSAATSTRALIVVREMSSGIHAIFGAETAGGDKVLLGSTTSDPVHIRTVNATRLSIETGGDIIAADASDFGWSDALLTRAAAGVMALVDGDRIGVAGAGASIETGQVATGAFDDTDDATVVALLTKGTDEQNQHLSFAQDGTPAAYECFVDLDTTGARHGDQWHVRVELESDGENAITVTFRNGSGGATIRQAIYSAAVLEQRTYDFVRTGSAWVLNDAVDSSNLIAAKAFSDIWAHVNAVALVISAVDTFTLVNTFANVGSQDAEGHVTGSVSTNFITANTFSGAYDLDYHVSLTVAGGAGKTIAFVPGITYATPLDITDMTDDLVSPIVVTSVAHGLDNGDMVTIADVLVNTAANGDWIVQNKTADTFELFDLHFVASTGNGDYDEGSATGEITVEYPGDSITRAVISQTDLVSVSARAEHAVAVGDTIGLYVVNLDGTENLAITAVNLEVDFLG